MASSSDSVFDHDLNELLKKAEQRASEIIRSNHREAFSYHNLYHTQSVVKVCGELCNAYTLSTRSKTTVSIAAWFHDAGYYDQINGHETIGAEYATEFLRTHNADDTLINSITELIRKTSIHTSPACLEEEIIRDADLHYLGIDRYFELADDLRQEWKQTLNKSYSDIEWAQQNIRFMESHHYYTQQAKQRFQDGKNQNIQTLRSRLS